MAIAADDVILHRETPESLPKSYGNKQTWQSHRIRQHTKNQQHYYTSTVSCLKKKLKKQFHFQQLQKRKQLGINLDLYDENYKSLTKERLGGHADMGRHLMLTDWKDYCESVHNVQSHLHVQCNLYQNSKDIFHRTRKILLKVVGTARLKIAKTKPRGGKKKAKQQVLYYLTLSTKLQ